MADSRPDESFVTETQYERSNRGTNIAMAVPNGHGQVTPAMLCMFIEFIVGASVGDTRQNKNLKE